MGCVKSKKSQSSEKATGGEKVYLVHAEMGLNNGSPVNPMLLEYAQKLSEEIVARAVQQWVEVDRRYGDIPYIECDVP
ncbi:small membrane A-kinase anchor protein-like [Synchiropus splendidus]|uniref:small membrane A-kinase anchor protein-like n=1 Tax=Synchiropus splendidus TaxID=270530 RepID=UPI00237E7BEA|nr:small membrane A-kinase anchor protein-like [Synchiropus splendidus]XP_053732157.1 small membrane A-kinase anchor protein-like [Synchiropus splendidus]